MTAELRWDVTGLSDSDADLARASAAGDTRAFAAIYDRYADRLHDFCVGMLADRDAAADCVQDAFCIAATRLPQLRDPDKLRPWLYSVARNEALRRLRDRRRETPSDDLPEIMSDDPGPDTMATRMELTDLIADAAGGLSDRDRSVLELAFRHGLGGPDLADALGVSLAAANQIVHRLRETIERSLGALMVSRRSQTLGGCPELAGILKGWDGNFNVLMRKRISRHIASCDICDEERRRLVNPVALLGAAPVFIPAPAWLRDRTLSEVQLTSASAPLTDDGSSQADDHRQADGADARSTNGYLIPVAVFVIALIASMSAAFIWLGQKADLITPTEVSTTAPLPAPASPPLPSLPPPPPPSLPPPPPAVSVATAPSIPSATPPTHTRQAPLPPPAPPVATTPVATTPVAEPSSPPAPPLPPPVQPPVPPPPPPPMWPDWIPDWSPPPPPGGGGTPPLVIDPATPPWGETALP